MPGVGPLDNPAPWLSANAPNEWWLAPTTDVWRDSPRSYGRFDISIIVAFVEAQVLGASWATRTAQHNRVERVRDEPLVMDIRAGDLGRKRHATTIGEDVALDPPLCAIRRVRDRSGPPFGCLHDRTVQ